MFFVERDDVEGVLHLTTGGENPYWSVLGDSNVLRLGGSPECEDIACKLNAFDAKQIRSIENDYQEVKCYVSMYGHRLKIFLVGQRVSHNKWQGIVSVGSKLKTSSVVTEAHGNDDKNAYEFAR